MKQNRISLLFSGGLDSAILLDWLLKKNFLVQPLYIRSGHVWEAAELFWIKKLLDHYKSGALKKLVVLRLPTDDLYQNHWSVTGRKTPGQKSKDEKVYIPGKNLLLISKAAVYCALHQIPLIALGPLKTNPFPDANLKFFKAIERACSQALDYPIEIRAPFISKTKQQVMQLGQNVPLKFTFSCISPVRKLHCGKCNKCAERKKAFRSIGQTDPAPHGGSF